MSLRKKNYTFVWLGAFVVGLFFLLALPRLSNQNTTPGKSANVDCLVSIPGRNLAYHVHPRLTVLVDGVSLEVPAGIGDSPNCLAELHTHDASGQLHVESFDPNKILTLGQFFATWGEDLEKEGFDLKATVSGEEVDNPAEIDLTKLDQKEIVLEYTRTSPETPQE